MKIDKRPLDLNHYDELSINQHYSAYELNIDDISIEDSEKIEWDYTSSGHKIFKSELTSKSNGNYKFCLIIAKSEIIY